LRCDVLSLFHPTDSLSSYIRVLSSLALYQRHPCLRDGTDKPYNAPHDRLHPLSAEPWFGCLSWSPPGLWPRRWVRRNGEQTLCISDSLAHASTRCNKNYEKGSPIVPPGGQFQIPAKSDSTLLVLRCTPIHKPYIAEDATSGAGFIIDTVVTYTRVQDAMPITLESTAKSLAVSISVGRNVLAISEVPINATKFEVPFRLTKLIPRKEPYTVSCSATYPGNQHYTTTASLSYLPNPLSGSVTKLDSRTGGLLTKPFGVGYAVDYTPVFPVGFYTSFDDYLAKNLSILDDLKARG